MQRQRGEWVPIGEVVSGLDDVLVPGDPLRLAPGAAPLHPGRSGEPAPRRITTSARINFEHRKGTAWEPRSRTG